MLAMPVAVLMTFVPSVMRHFTGMVLPALNWPVPAPFLKTGGASQFSVHTV